MGNGTSALAIGSLVCGIISIVMICCCSYIAIPLGIVGAILGFVELSRISSNQSNPAGRPIALAGTITGIIGAVGAILYIVLSLLGFVALSAMNTGGNFH